MDDYVRCRRCGSGFWRGSTEYWKTRCIDCWRDSKTSREELESLRVENAELRAENYRWREAARKLALDDAKMLEIELLLSRVADGMNHHWSFVLRRIHPDTNGGTPEATAATRWLLETRDIVAAFQHRINGNTP